RTGTSRASSISETCRPVLPCLPPDADVTSTGLVMTNTSWMWWYCVVPMTRNVWCGLVPSQGRGMAAKEAVKPAAADAEEAPVRQRILEAAFSAFMERGFAETSTLEIATRAKASKRELYAQFGGKHEILAACIAERAKRLRLPSGLPEPRDRETLAQA